MTELTAAFALTASANLDKRTITGTVVPFGVVGHTNLGPTIIEAGAVQPGDKVVLLMEHDRTRPIGLLATSVIHDDRIEATFRVTGTSAGDDALLEAADRIRDGLSVGLDAVEYDVDQDGVVHVTAGVWRETSLVTFPAFTEARVDRVAATEAPAPAPDADTPTEEEHTVTEVTEAVAEVTAAEPQHLAAAFIPRAHVQDAFPYRETVRDDRGVQASFFRDMIRAQHDPEAAERYRVAQTMLTAAAGVQTDIAEIIPTQYRPDMYVGQLSNSRPVIDAFSRQSIDGPNPQRVPRFKAASGLNADHVENTNPAEGAFETDEVVITPKAVSGIYKGSREMFEGSTPAVDALIMNAIREEYASETEAYAATTFLTGATAGTVVDISNGVTLQVIERMITFQANRKRAADVLLAGTTLFPELVKQVDLQGRPLNPYVGATNAPGSIGMGALSVNVGGYVTPYVASLTDGLLGVREDAVTFESGLRMWRWEEKSGPATIEIAAFGYIACAVLRPLGLLKFATQA
jgi:HK97 family phage major capsid protein